MKRKSIFLILALLGAMGLLALACGGSEDDTALAIPHGVTNQEDATCLGCHQNGSSGASKTPHPERTGCVTCHKVKA